MFYSYQEPQIQTLHPLFPKGPKLILGLRSLAKALWLCNLAALPRPVTTKTSLPAQGLSQAGAGAEAGAGLPRTPWLGLDRHWQLDSLLPCRRVLAATFAVIIATTALDLLIWLLCKIQSGTFKKEKVVMKGISSS